MKKLAALITSRTGKTVIFLALSVLYIAALIVLFFNLQLGVILWAAAMIPSLMVYIHQKRNERIRAEMKAAQEAEKEE